ncbi:hypothetical protein OG728_38550 (plasmid) [Streptomyces microflavus]|uniref:hypothetical protein n=1 Tax=Streptomyces microflavus TaxID=1919 RepID=UPI002E14AEBA|nr:hypothetical protein OG728_38550 [Streptomyces microflavus]
MIPDLMQTGNYGIGAFFPLIILDPTPHWHNQGPGTTPRRCSQETGHLLAVRWCAPDHMEDQAAQALTQAKKTAPAADVLSAPAHLAAFHESLPPHTNLIALPTSCVIGPWARRPGRLRAMPRPRPSDNPGSLLIPAA